MPVRREGDGSYTDLGSGSAFDYPRHISGGVPDTPAAPGQPLGLVEVPTWWPARMTNEEYLSWLAADWQLPRRQQAGVPCADCSASFARTASDAGHCNRPHLEKASANEPRSELGS